MTSVRLAARRVMVGLVATLALSLGLAAPAHAANVRFDCGNSSTYHACNTYTGAAEHYSGWAGLTATGDGGWRVGVEPDNGFTLVVRVWPSSGGSIDYPVSADGRELYYDIYAVQVVVVGHKTSNRLFV